MFLARAFNNLPSIKVIGQYVTPTETLPIGRVNCPCPKQGRNSEQSTFKVQYLLREWVDCDLEVLWVELKQILHLKVGCSDFRPCSGQGQFTLPTHTYSPLDLKFDFMEFDAKPYRNNSRPYNILPLSIPSTNHDIHVNLSPTRDVFPSFIFHFQNPRPSRERSTHFTFCIQKQLMVTGRERSPLHQNTMRFGSVTS